jgi:hypothetical protein
MAKLLKVSNDTEEIIKNLVFGEKLFVVVKTGEFGGDMA